MTDEMDLDEAKRRFEKALVLSGYAFPSGPWMDSAFDGKTQIHSRYLEGLYGARAVLWKEKDGWAVVISFQVGEWGEFPLLGSRLTRWNEDKWKPLPPAFIEDNLQRLAEQIRRWDQSPSNSLGYVAMIKLALSYFKLGTSNLNWLQIKKGQRILMGAIRGEIAKATISEALSIVQMKWCRSREERLRSALIWSGVFK